MHVRACVPEFVRSTYVHTYTHTHAWMDMKIWMDGCIDGCVRVIVYIWMSAYICTYVPIYVCRHICTHVLMHACMHRHTNSHTYKDTSISYLYRWSASWLTFIKKGRQEAIWVKEQNAKQHIGEILLAKYCKRRQNLGKILININGWLDW